jgi:hypothetical protein
MKVKRTEYKNGISCKFDNRRVTVVKMGGEYIFEFKVADGDPVPHAVCRFDRGKVAVTAFKLSPESSEMMMRSLAELMGYAVIKNPPAYRGGNG